MAKQKPSIPRSIHEALKSSITSATAYPIDGFPDIFFRQLSTKQAMGMRDMKAGDEATEEEKKKSELKMIELINTLCYDGAGPDASPVFKDIKLSDLPFAVTQPIMEAFMKHMVVAKPPLVQSESFSSGSPNSAALGTSTN